MHENNDLKRELASAKKTIIELQAELQNVSRHEDCKCEQVDILRQQLGERHIETQNARENLAIKIAEREEDAKIIRNLEGLLAQKQALLIKEPCCCLKKTRLKKSEI